MKKYSHAGLAGCVQLRRARATKTLVGVYHGVQSGIDAEPSTPWVAVCEEHGSILSCESLKLAKSQAVEPEGWCSECRGDET